MKNYIFIPSIITFILICLMQVSCRKSYDPGDWNLLPRQAEVPDPGPQEPEGPTVSLKVMSYNARLGNAADLTKLIEYVKAYDPDILFLRQVDSATTRANKINRPLAVAEATNMESFFAKGFDYQTGGYGNAILSKYPIESSLSTQLHPDAELGGEVRSMPLIRIKIDELNSVVVTGTELDPGQLTNRILQIGTLLSITSRETDPVILVGNFNDNEASQTFTMIQGQFTFGCVGAGCPKNSPAAAPTGTYDFITFKPSDRFSVENYGTFPQTTSNFLPITATLKLKLIEAE